MLHRVTLSLLVSMLLPATGLSAQTTSTLSAETANNTSAAASFSGWPNGNAAPANVSKLPIRQLLYPGATTRIYAHLQPWFCNSASPCNGHKTVGYDSADGNQVARQIDDMMSRGIDGVIINWYGKPVANCATSPLAKPCVEDETTQRFKEDAQTRGGFELAVMLDQRTWDVCTTSDCSTVSGRTTEFVNDLNYAADNYFNSPAYLHRVVNGQSRPVVFFFMENYGDVDWNRIRGEVRGNPLLIHRNAGAFSQPVTDGGFAWMDPANQPESLGYLADFYNRAHTAPAPLRVFGSGFKGIDDSQASWGQGKLVKQLCGKTWLDTFAEVQASGYYGPSNELPDLQIVTWNDYEEGTEIETGIDNCYSISASVSGSTLSWGLQPSSPDATENTIDHYAIWDSADGEHLTLAGTRPRGTSSAALSTLSLGSGTRTLYVQAVGRPSIRNRMSNAVSGVVTAPITITAPASGATVQSKVHVAATENTSRAATSMQIYLDSTLTFTQYNTDSIDTDIDAGCGTHQLTVKAWYADGTNSPLTRNFTVDRANLVTTPANGATVISPVHVVSTSCSDHPVTSTQIYLDDALKTETSTATLDQSIAMPSGSHCIVGKGWDSVGNSFLTTPICFTVR